MQQSHESDIQHFLAPDGKSLYASVVKKHRVKKDNSVHNNAVNWDQYDVVGSIIKRVCYTKLTQMSLARQVCIKWM